MMEEFIKQVNEALRLLEQISEDTSVPRNIRRAATNSIEILHREDLELELRAINAIEMLDEVTQDPNCPLHARAKVYATITRLELPYDDDGEDDYVEEENDEDDDDYDYDDDV
ncbi:MAG: UPF0147 family protein [Candidatus Heimdallarchaeota archaeon]|nr:UPF0147 family protein [Candidatus Heimdallarchaeota archaeon]MCK5048777.1 UPF0147 family protein [Candidatus Heimdallarchaeota archaeon]